MRVGADRSLVRPPRPFTSTVVVAGDENDGKDEEHERGERGGKKANNASPAESTAATKPNVFFILIDDMGWSDIGYQSLDLQGTTPYLDRLAAGGVKVIEIRRERVKVFAIPRVAAWLTALPLPVSSGLSFTPRE